MITLYLVMTKNDPGKGIKKKNQQVHYVLKNTSHTRSGLALNGELFWQVVYARLSKPWGNVKKVLHEGSCDAETFQNTPTNDSTEERRAECRT